MDWCKNHRIITWWTFHLHFYQSSSSIPKLSFWSRSCCPFEDVWKGRSVVFLAHFKWDNRVDWHRNYRSIYRCSFLAHLANLFSLFFWNLWSLKRRFYLFRWLTFLGTFSFAKVVANKYPSFQLFPSNQYYYKWGNMDLHLLERDINPIRHVLNSWAGRIMDKKSYWKNRTCMRKKGNFSNSLWKAKKSRNENWRSHNVVKNWMRNLCFH